MTLTPCRSGRGFCTFSFRIEKIDGTLVQRGLVRVPRSHERLVLRCPKCGKEREHRDQ